MNGCDELMPACAMSSTAMWARWFVIKVPREDWRVIKQDLVNECMETFPEIAENEDDHKKCD